MSDPWGLLMTASDGGVRTGGSGCRCLPGGLGSDSCWMKDKVDIWADGVESGEDKFTMTVEIDQREQKIGEM
jgi:hypothetical protein